MTRLTDKPSAGPLAIKAAQLRKQAGVTLYALQELSGINRGTLLRIERGTHRYPTVSTLNRLAKAYAIDPTILHDAAWEEHTSPVPSLRAWARRRHGIDLTPEQADEAESYLLRLASKDEAS